jgi:hypothetical protein
VTTACRPAPAIPVPCRGPVAKIKMLLGPKGSSFPSSSSSRILRPMPLPPKYSRYHSSGTSTDQKHLSIEPPFSSQLLYRCGCRRLHFVKLVWYQVVRCSFLLAKANQYSSIRNTKGNLCQENALPYSDLLPTGSSVSHKESRVHLVVQNLR